jgi:hypothetical protein
MKIEQYLDGLASMHGRPLNAMAARMFLNALSKYPEHLVVEALEKCSIELRTFPTLADIISRIQQMDGRPGVEEAWSMCPKTEAQSVVWTEEIRDAFLKAAIRLIDTDEIAARMAFKEKYTKLLSEARYKNIPAKWEVSLGHEKTGREKAINTAIGKGILTQQEARMLLPDNSQEFNVSEESKDFGKKLLEQVNHEISD